MADLNALIAQGAQFQALPDPFAQYGKVAAIQSAQNQNALAQLQMQQAQREQESTNALNAAYAAAYNPNTGAIDINKLRQTIATGGFGSKLPALEKSLSELEKQKLEQDKLKGEIAAQPLARSKAENELIDFKLKQSRSFLDTIDPADPNAPQEFLAWYQANHADPILGPALKARGITAEQSLARINQAVAAGPQAFAQLLAQSKLGTERFMELNKPTVSQQDLGGQTQFVSVPGLGGQASVVPGSVQAKTMTPGEANRLIVSQGQLQVAQQQANLAQQRFNWEKANPGFSVQETGAGFVAVNNKNPNDVRPISLGGQALGPKPVYNTQAGGFITPPVAGGQPGFTPIPEVQQTKDQQAAVKALKSAGYDPETGTDTISKLIEKSTSGRLQAGTAATLAFFGQTTEGRKAIAALEGTANQIATDLAGGKLGAGISNTDREFIVSALGDVANPNKTSEERLAGWTAAKNRMISTGLIPTPAPGKPAATLAPADKQALDWANANPKDPRALQIKQRLGQ